MSLISNTRSVLIQDMAKVSCELPGDKSTSTILCIKWSSHNLFLLLCYKATGKPACNFYHFITQGNWQARDCNIFLTSLLCHWQARVFNIFLPHYYKAIEN